MTVAELIERLRDLDPRMEVVAFRRESERPRRVFAGEIRDVYRAKAFSIDADGDAEDEYRIVRLGSSMAPHADNEVVFLDAMVRP